MFLNDVLIYLVFLYFIVQISSVFYRYASFFSLITWKFFCISIWIRTIFIIFAHLKIKISQFLFICKKIYGIVIFVYFYMRSVLFSIVFNNLHSWFLFVYTTFTPFYFPPNHPKVSDPFPPRWYHTVHLRRYNRQ